MIRDIRDPEKPETLEELNVVYEEGVTVKPLNEHTSVIQIEFKPTISHCSLATLIGNYLYYKISIAVDFAKQNLHYTYKKTFLTVKKNFF